MHPFPHRYHVTANGSPDGGMPLRSPDLPDITATAPPEFDGPEGSWSPETLLTGAVATCLILTFRSLSRRADLAWEGLEVTVDGELDKTREGLRFTAFDVTARLDVGEDVDAVEAENILRKAEEHCLVTRSLTADVNLKVEVRQSR